MDRNEVSGDQTSSELIPKLAESTSRSDELEMILDSLPLICTFKIREIDDIFEVSGFFTMNKHITQCLEIVTPRLFTPTNHTFILSGTALKVYSYYKDEVEARAFTASLFEDNLESMRDSTDTVVVRKINRVLGKENPESGYNPIQEHFIMCSYLSLYPEKLHQITEKGDYIEIVMEETNLSYREAVEYLLVVIRGILIN
jgi:hypothetical protein